MKPQPRNPSNILSGLLLFTWLFQASFLLGTSTSTLHPQADMTYYVSSSTGDDLNNGLSESTPLATLGRVNGLDLQPGDHVLLKCGDTWHNDPLTVAHSGTVDQRIVYGTYPAGCANRPILTGAQPVTGWVHSTGNIYMADLSAGTNAGKFGYGVNQLFRNNIRMPMGRWPNLDAGNGGYAQIDAQPANNQITDNQLPTGDWTGAVAHIRGMRWYILNRRVSGDSGQTLILGADAGCWGSCAGWGYFLNSHISTLDQEGEWYHDSNTNRLYLVSTTGVPADGQVEASIISKDDTRAWGGVNLGVDLQSNGIAYVTIENLKVQRWFRHGITSPTNLAHTENHDIILQNNHIHDVDSIGINLMTWVYSATDGRADGWRGGYNLVVQSNTIEVANRMGINTSTRDSTFADNLINDVGMIENLGAAGMGCDFDDGEGQCTEDGDGLRVKADKPADSGHTNLITGNRLERIAYNGMDIFGHHNTVQNNLIHQACYAKGDCGGVRTFGSTSLALTPVHDLVFRQNIIADTTGNTDGCATDYQSLFGFGFYIDHYSRDVTIEENRVISSTVHGILYQNSTGQINGNTLYNNGWSADWSAQVWLTGAPTFISSQTGNILFSLNPDNWTLSLEDLSSLGTSNQNAFFHPYRLNQIRAGGSRSFSGWQTYSGKDASSRENWYSQLPGEQPRSHIFYNELPSTIVVDLGARQYLDLDQNPVWGSLTLEPYRSQILIDNGAAPLSILSIAPPISVADEAADFSLQVYGSGFTPASVVRWNGSDRTTTFISSTYIQAAIGAVDVNSVANHLVSVYDPTIGASGSETSTLTFRVVAELVRNYLPSIIR
jgi:parallel beta-helix repeat protein